MLESAIVSQRIQYSSEQVKRIQTDIEALLREPSTDSSYLARLYALSADVYLLQRQPNEARKRLVEAKQQNEYDEYVQLVSARIISDQEKRRAYLEERLIQNPTYYRLKAELGGLYFAVKTIGMPSQPLTLRFYFYLKNISGSTVNSASRVYSFIR